MPFCSHSKYLSNKVQMYIYGGDMSDATCKNMLKHAKLHTFTSIIAGTVISQQPPVPIHFPRPITAQAAKNAYRMVIESRR